MPAVQVLGHEPQPERGHAALAHEIGHDPAGLVDGNGKADALGAGVHCGVDADDAALECSTAAAAVAGINGRVGLDQVR